MKTFRLDHNGDVVISDNKIEMVSGTGLVMQTLKQVLNTNLNEWFSDKEEGIDYSVILTKNPNYDLIRDTINTAVAKVGEQLGIELETDNFTFEIVDRKMNIDFTIKLDNGDSDTVSVTL